MPEVRFYHLTRATLEATLPVMLQRVLERGQKAVVQLGSEERAEALSAYLWSYDDSAFLPHGTSKDGNADQQPIWLTAQDEPPPNGAEVLFSADGAETQRVQDYQLCVFLFDGKDEAALAKARERWRTFKAEGFDVTYWRQDDSGRWSKVES